MFNTYFLSFTFSSVTVATVLTGLQVDGLEWLDLLYFFSYIKLYISFAKYVPQVSCVFSAPHRRPFAMQPLSHSHAVADRRPIRSFLTWVM